jgi:hypothetical protein
MKRNIYITLIIVLYLNIIYAQLLSDVNNRTVPNNIHGQLDYSILPLFSTERFSFNQGFSMSMASHGSIATSIASYSNNITYWASDNLKINANVLLYAPTGMTNPNLESGPQLALDAGITYKTTKNSYIHLNFQKIPSYGLRNNLFKRTTFNNSFFLSN